MRTVDAGGDSYYVMTFNKVREDESGTLHEDDTDYDNLVKEIHTVTTHLLAKSHQEELNRSGSRPLAR
eukprot:9504191-Pyramimonas_sp.AAC.4